MTEKTKFEDLTRDIDWQRASFLKYCVDITDDASRQSSEEAIVRKILGGYLMLALLFYKQFRQGLKKEYEESADMLEENVRPLMQQAVDKLVEEWYRVYAIIIALRARRTNDASRTLLMQMDPFIGEAMKDVALSRDKFPVILQFGQSYSLRFSNYSDNFAALSIPLWVLESPWEWTILWHELAGEKVRKLKNDDPNFFGSLLNNILNQFDDDQKLAVKNSGWSTDWLEELFEDSFSIIHFPIHFLIVFKNLLKRYPEGGKGSRHPSDSIRLAVAMCLHMQMKKDCGLPADMQSWRAPQWSQWTELENETNPDRFKEFDPEKQLSDAIEIKMAYVAAEQIMQWHIANKVTETGDASVFRKLIGNAIIKYARGLNYQQITNETLSALAAIPPAAEAAQQESDDPAYLVLCDRVRLKKGLLDTLPPEVLAEHPQVEKLLAGLGYKELLDLAFSYTDFHNLDDIHFIQGALKYWINHTTWNDALFDAQGNPRGKFFPFDGNPQHLKLGFIEIQQLGFDASGLEIVMQRWQSVFQDWDGLQKSQV